MNLHALLEEAEGLREVANAKVVTSPQLRVFHLEVEPLLVALRISVHFAEKVVLLDDCVVRGALHVDDLVDHGVGLDALKITTLYRRVKLEVLRVKQPMIASQLRQILTKLVRLLGHCLVVAQLLVILTRPEKIELLLQPKFPIDGLSNQFVRTTYGYQILIE